VLTDVPRTRSPGIRRLSVAGAWHHLRADSLYRNSAYLLLNLGLSAVAGFVCTLICTRWYSPTEFGYATAMFSSLGLAVSAGNLGLVRTVARFLGRSGTRSRDITTYLLLISAGSTVTGIAVGSSLSGAGIARVTPAVIAVFVVAVVITSVKSVVDGAFVAVRTASGTLLSNLTFSVIRIALAAALAGTGYLVIFGTSLVAVIVALAVSLVLLVTRIGIRLPARPSLAAMRGRWSFALGSYTSDLIGGLPTSIVPLIVVGQLGPVVGALWFTVIQVIGFMLTVSSSINQAMFAEMSNAEHGMRQFVKKALLSMYALLLPLTAVVVIFARPIMSIFSPSYVAAADVLRLMAIFALIGVTNYISGSIIAWHRKTFYLTAVNAVNAVVTIAYCYFVATDLTGVAVGWIWGEVTNALLFVGGCLYFHQRAQRRPRTDVR